MGTVKSISDLIDSIKVDPQNFIEIANSGQISGELKAEISRIFIEYIQQN